MTMQVAFLAGKEEIQAEWAALAPLFDKVVSRAVHGEFGTDDIYRLAMAGKVHVGLVREAGEIIMAMAFEFRQYPQKLAVSFLAMGGKKLDAVMSRFFAAFSEWAKAAGADWIEASCSPAMARIHARNRFKPVYQLIRLDLTNLTNEGEER